MFALNFQVDTNAIEALYQSYQDELLKRLNELQDKVFDVAVGDKIYQISYQLNNGEILLFSHNSDGFDDYKIALPKLRLNVSRHFLPDALNLDGSVPDPFYDEDAVMSSEGGLVSSDAQELMAEITKIGFLKVIGLKK